MTFVVTGTTTNGTQGKVYNLTTGPGSVVGVLNDRANNPTYYLNTGLLLFEQNDVIYGLGDRKGGGVIGLLPTGS